MNCSRIRSRPDLFLDALEHFASILTNADVLKKEFLFKNSITLITEVSYTKNNGLRE